MTIFSIVTIVTIVVTSDLTAIFIVVTIVTITIVVTCGLTATYAQLVVTMQIGTTPNFMVIAHIPRERELIYIILCQPTI